MQYTAEVNSIISGFSIRFLAVLDEIINSSNKSLTCLPLSTKVIKGSDSHTVDPSSLLARRNFKQGFSAAMGSHCPPLSKVDGVCGV